MDRVLIFSSSSGGAHAAAAAALAEGLGEDQRLPVEVCDLHDFLTPVERWFYQKGQFVFLNAAPGVTGAFVHAAQQSASLAAFARPWYPVAVSSVRAMLERVRPTAVVATHPLGALILDRVRPLWRGPLFLLPVNYEAHRFHVYRSVTTYCAPHALVAEDFRKLGVPPAAIAVTGLPLGSTFDALPSPADAREKLGIPLGVPVVLVSQGAVGSGPWTIPLIHGLVRALPPETHFLILTGRNHAVARALDALALPPRVRRAGLVTEFHTYLRAADLLVGKAGGMSSTAAFAAGTPLLIFTPNALEVESARRFVSAGVALSGGRSVRDTVSLAVVMLARPEKRHALRDAAARFVVTGGRQRIAGLVRQAWSAAREQVAAPKVQDRSA